MALVLPLLLGLGAVLNQACVFGTVARLGSGEWAYAATPLGFYLGSASVGAVFPPLPAMPLPTGSPLSGAPAWLPDGHSQTIYPALCLGGARPAYQRALERGGPYALATP